MKDNPNNPEIISLDDDHLLRAKLQAYRKLFTHAPAAMFFYNTDATVKYVNQEACKLFKINHTQFIGSNILSIIRHTPLRHAVQQSLSSGYATFEEHFTSPKEDREYTYCGKFQAIYDTDNTMEGVIALIFEVDIENISRQENLIAQVQANRYFEAAGVMILSLDHNANVVRINTKGCEITGYTQEELVGKNWISLCIPPEVQNEIQNVFRQVISREVPLKEHYENDIITKSGERRTIAWHNSVICDFDGNIIEVLSTGEDITELKASRLALLQQKLYDPLTGLPNRMMLHDRLQHALILAKDNGEKTALFYIDLDNFNVINDILGHAKGDEILKECVRRIEEILQPADTLARFGGDEFIIIQEDIGEISEVNFLAQELLNIFNQPFFIGESSHYLSASIGIALFPQNSQEPQTLIQAAETAMNRAKKEGKNQFAFYTEALSQSLYEQMTIENDLRKALDNQEFVLHFQPQYSLQKKEVIGLEALVRWHHPQKGMIPPFAFIPVAERSRLILPLGEWIMTEAALQAAKWHKAGIFNGKIAVNVSGVQMERDNLLETIDKALEISQLPPHMLEIEITESVLMKNPQRWISMLDEIKHLGISVSIDDFGTGYSSLAYLRHFALDTLKIDKSFVDDLPDDEDACTIAKTIVALAKSLGLETVAEGIEETAQEIYLHGIGCDYGQGYLFSKPLDGETTEKFLKTFQEN